MYKKVSIITPCYNGEKFIEAYLNSILNQTYKNIELILINDGSTDKTEEIVKSYMKKFKDQGMDIIYIYQENGGQATALNKGLNLFTGEYLTWPDSDDILTIDSIEKKVKFLDNNRDYYIVRSDGKLVDENNINKVLGYFGKGNKEKFKEDLFLDYIIENNVWFAPGCFMVRSDKFLEINPLRQIYNSRAGQNWQMILPILYKSKCGLLDESLYIYRVRANSHSHSVTTLNEQIKRCNDHEDILINTMKCIEMEEFDRDKYINLIKEKYIRKKLYIAEEFKEHELAKIQYDILKKRNVVNNEDRIVYLSSKNKMFNLIGKVLRKIRRAL
ncbi:MAG: glycosyltransferase family A protein [Romboutsia sp.]